MTGNILVAYLDITPLSSLWQHYRGAALAKLGPGGSLEGPTAPIAGHLAFIDNAVDATTDAIAVRESSSARHSTGTASTPSILAARLATPKVTAATVGASRSESGTTSGPRTRALLTDWLRPQAR